MRRMWKKIARDNTEGLKNPRTPTFRFQNKGKGLGGKKMTLITQASEQMAVTRVLAVTTGILNSALNIDQEIYRRFSSGR